MNGKILYFKDLFENNKSSFIEFIKHKYDDVPNEWEIIREKREFLQTHLESLGYHMLSDTKGRVKLHFARRIFSEIFHRWDTEKWNQEFKIDPFHSHSFNTDNSKIKGLFLDTFYRNYNGKIGWRDINKYYGEMDKIIKENDGISSWQVSEEIDIIKPLFEDNFKCEKNDILFTGNIDKYIIMVEKLYSINILLPLVVAEWQLNRFPYDFV
jgi:hypothetical protein